MEGAAGIGVGVVWSPDIDCHASHWGHANGWGGYVSEPLSHTSEASSAQARRHAPGEEHAFRTHRKIAEMRRYDQDGL